MDDLTLRSGTGQPPTPLASGRHGLRGNGAGEVERVEADQARVVVQIDRRGAWLHVPGDAAHVHVNGRPVRRIAMLRPGDVLHLEDAQAVLAGRAAQAVDSGEAGQLSDPEPGHADDRIVLRVYGGEQHGRSFSLDRRCHIDADGTVHPAESPHAPKAAGLCLQRADDGVVLQRLHEGSEVPLLVNGHAVGNALLQDGDQILYGTQRFLLEAPGGMPSVPPDVLAPATVHPDEAAQDAVTRPARAATWPWILLAALILAGLLAALLLGGSEALSGAAQNP